jgi:hypothetical protein
MCIVRALPVRVPVTTMVHCIRQWYGEYHTFAFKIDVANNTAQLLLQTETLFTITQWHVGPVTAAGTARKHGCRAGKREWLRAPPYTIMGVLGTQSHPHSS